MLLAPLALVLSVLAVPIILLYVLKLRRQEYVVPSTFLWRQVLDDIQANAPWQRLRFNILLLLQLLALAALILSLARPVFSRSHVIAGDLVLIVDESYGMQAHDVTPSRFAAALTRAHTLASELGSGGLMTVIGMAAQPHLVIADSGDQGAIGRAIDGLHVGVDQPNFLDALSLASSLARTGRTTHVVVLTSRDSGISTLPLQVSFPVDVVRVGAQLRDLAITTFTASRRDGMAEAVARVSNFGAQTAKSDLELFADGRLEDVRPLTVPGRSQQNLFWTDLPPAVQRLQLRLTHPDDVATDKTAYSAISALPVRRVLLISRGDFFLQSALLDDPSVRLATLQPSSYFPGIERAYDLTIFDGVLPPVLPAESALLIAPPVGQSGPLRFGRNLSAGTVAEVASAPAGPLASLLQYVDLSDVHVAQTRSTVLPGWLQPLAASNGHTVLAAGERNTVRLALVNFDLQRSDWPLRISFPIMLQNLLHYLTPGLTLGQTTMTTGQAVRFFPPPGTKELEVRRPDGTVDHVRPPFPPFADTARPGLYQVVPVGGSGLTQVSSFAVNFFPRRPAPAVGSATLHLGQAQARTSLVASVPIGVAPVFMLLAALILGLEWWVAFGATVGSRGAPRTRWGGSA